MRGNSAKFYNIGEKSIESGSNNLPVWLKQFARQRQAQELMNQSKNAVEVARNRTQEPVSIYERMVAVLGPENKPKFSSVEEIVKDYQNRTGLSSYLKQSIKESSEKIKAIAECITKDDEQDVRWDPERETLIAESDDSPEILKKNPVLEHYIINLIETNHKIQLPAILNSIRETFGKDSIETDGLFYNEELLNWINQLLLARDANDIEYISHNIGKGVGIQAPQTLENDSNKDPFALLVPNNK